jgi:hypothetical protein
MKRMLVVVALLLSVGAAFAQGSDPILNPASATAAQGTAVPESATSPNEGYGPGFQQTWYAGTGFNPIDPTKPWYYQQWLYYAKTTGSGIGIFAVPIELPNGALLSDFCAYLYDNDGSNDATIFLYKYTYNIATNGNSATLLASVGTSGSPGYYNACVVVSPAETIEHNTGDYRNSYITTAWMPTSADVRFRAIRLDWQRQVSPAPATATFGDVPTNHWAFRFVEALYASGITAGCGGGNFCPDQPLTRAQMAVFLSAALGLHFPN